MRCSATEVDGYRWAVKLEKPMADYLRELRHEEPPNEAMMMGSAFHVLLEQAQAGEEISHLRVFMRHGERAGSVESSVLALAAVDENLEDTTSVEWPFHYFFHLDDFDAAISLPPVREMKTELNLVVDGTPVTVAMKADGLDGLTVHEHKLTKRFDPDTYADALQWRFYLLGFGADSVQYNVFVRADRPGPHVYVYELHQLRFWRYPQMEDDVRRALGEFVAFCRRWLPERFEAMHG